MDMVFLLARALKDREILSANQGSLRPGKCTWEMQHTATFAYDVYEGFQRKEQTLALAIDLKDAYNRVLALTQPDTDLVDCKSASCYEQ